MKSDETMNETGSAVAARRKVRGDERTPPAAGLSNEDLRLVFGALSALKRGEGSVRLPVEWAGMAGKVAETFNDVVELNARMAEELSRLRDKVGKEGKLKQRADIGDVRGFWRGSIASVNALIDDLVHPTSETARVIGAVAQGDTRRINTERAFAVSVILHLLLVIALPTVKLPARTAAQDTMDPLGLMSLMSSPPPDPAIPIQFFPAPGARAKEAPKTGLPSDMDRRAHGGDRALPVMPVPKAYPQAGIRDLEAGKQGPKVAAAPPAAQPPAGSPVGEHRKLTDLAPGGTLHDPPTAEERARQRLLGIPGPDLSAITAEAARKAAQAGGGGEEGGAGHHPRPERADRRHRHRGARRLRPRLLRGDAAHPGRQAGIGRQRASRVARDRERVLHRPAVRERDHHLTIL